MIKNIIYSFIIAFILFGAYVEINPQMTNIWWRINSSGDKQLVISNLFLLIFAPFEYMFYWNLNAWDINFFIWWIIIFIMLIIYDYYKKKF
jgi:hypothetical protein